MTTYGSGLVIPEVGRDQYWAGAREFPQTTVFLSPRFFPGLPAPAVPGALPDCSWFPCIVQSDRVGNYPVEAG